MDVTNFRLLPCEYRYLSLFILVDALYFKSWLNVSKYSSLHYVVSVTINLLFVFLLLQNKWRQHQHFKMGFFSSCWLSDKTERWNRVGRRTAICNAICFRCWSSFLIVAAGLFSIFHFAVCLCFVVLLARIEFDFFYAGIDW